MPRYTHRHPTEKEIAEARETAPRGVWLATGARADEPYPCRCAEAKFGRCNAAFCPCSGRPDPQGANCCGHRFGPEEAARAAAAWQEKKERERAGL